MTELMAQVAHRLKAVAGGVTSGLVAYTCTAVINGDVLTLNGLKVALATAVLTAYRVHQTVNLPAPKQKAKKKA